jgi:hypothetical protein
VDSGVVLVAVDEAEVGGRLFVAIAGLAGYWNAPNPSAYMNFRRGILKDSLGRLQGVNGMAVASVDRGSLGKRLQRVLLASLRKII